MVGLSWPSGDISLRNIWHVRHTSLHPGICETMPLVDAYCVICSEILQLREFCLYHMPDSELLAATAPPSKLRELWAYISWQQWRGSLVCLFFDAAQVIAASECLGRLSVYAVILTQDGQDMPVPWTRNDAIGKVVRLRFHRT